MAAAPEAVAAERATQFAAEDSGGARPARRAMQGLSIDTCGDLTGSPTWSSPRPVLGSENYDLTQTLAAFSLDDEHSARTSGAATSRGVTSNHSSQNSVFDDAPEASCARATRPPPVFGSEEDGHAQLDMSSSLNRDLWDSLNTPELPDRFEREGVERTERSAGGVPRHAVSYDAFGSGLGGDYLSSSPPEGYSSAYHAAYYGPRHQQGYGQRPPHGRYQKEPIRRTESHSGVMGVGFGGLEEEPRYYSPGPSDGVDYDRGYAPHRRGSPPGGFLDDRPLSRGEMYYGNEPRSARASPRHGGHFPPRSPAHHRQGYHSNGGSRHGSPRNVQRRHPGYNRAHALSEDSYAPFFPPDRSAPHPLSRNGSRHFDEYGVPPQPQMSLQTVSLIGSNGVQLKGLQALQTIDPTSGQAKMYIAGPDGTLTPAHLVAHTTPNGSPILSGMESPHHLRRSASTGSIGNRSPKRESPADERPLNLAEEAVDGKIYEIFFKRGSRFFFLHPRAPRDIAAGDYVKVEADRGEDLGRVVAAHPLAAFVAEDSAQPTAGFKSRYASLHERKRVLRVAADDEVAVLGDKGDDEDAVLKICRQKAKFRGLPMTVFDAEYQFDRHKLTFFFKAERRIDFRELVRDLFAVYKTRIWLQQIDPGAEGTANFSSAAGAATVATEVTSDTGSASPTATTAPPAATEPAAATPSLVY